MVHTIIGTMYFILKFFYGLHPGLMVKFGVV